MNRQHNTMAASGNGGAKCKINSKPERSGQHWAKWKVNRRKLNFCDRRPKQMSAAAEPAPGPIDARLGELGGEQGEPGELAALSWRRAARQRPIVSARRARAPWPASGQRPGRHCARPAGRVSRPRRVIHQPGLGPGAGRKWYPARVLQRD